MKINKKIIDKLFNILRKSNSEITKQFFLYKNTAEKKLSRNAITNNSVNNIYNDSSITNSHQPKFTKDQYTSTANTNEALIMTTDISDNNKFKNDVNNTANNKQNFDNDVERVGKNGINVENQLKEIRKSSHQRDQNGQRKPNNKN